MTFSIVARDEKSGAFGACGYTDIAGYGAIVPHVSLCGAAATQAYANVDNGLEVMQLLSAGQSAEAAGEAVLDGDEGRNMRQLLVIGQGPDHFAWTGADCIPWHGHIIADNHVASANCIKSQAVLDAISETFQATQHEEFTLRLIKAIQAGEAAGGHVDTVDVSDEATGEARTLPTAEVFGGVMSAAVMVASPEPEMWHNLRVDAHPSAIHELAETYRNARLSAERVATFYKGAIRIKPYYWRWIGKTRN
ncbi:MAG: DUF1028 domain-containing protein [Rhodospirillaceae bacterium]|jgi:uncharacterized Ntn-hydrolase superfamily protein|nr:DUF1028 domain-containing protein [Rhodospirillaceae bacterium]MBT4428058.1 DUF1028 domain-containing protein [Rhodospirillaceae bacterium]MBT5038882.1 DUF1028 domain-containing protein [Rhodospirillaceae bacterium]MBT5674979.1 DUF1028 domain-containing protein [Rhodospirillaceae bacterium]MBT7291199.1 DUF1028 domain-containing protein [Rhodospirillaceae bacterium]